MSKVVSTVMWKAMGIVFKNNKQTNNKQYEKVRLQISFEVLC